MNSLPPTALFFTLVALHTAYATSPPSLTTDASVACTGELETQEKVRKKDREQAIQKLKARLAPLMKYDIKDLDLALTIKVRQKYTNARVYAADRNRTFLGTIGSQFAATSIFNSVGQHGSTVSPRSIWNDVGLFGGEVGLYSPFNDVSVSPPVIVKGGKVIGRLTVNELTPGRVDPHWLKYYFTN